MANKINGSTSSIFGQLHPEQQQDPAHIEHPESKKKHIAKQFFEDVMQAAMMESMRVYHSVISLLQEKRLTAEIEQKLKEQEIKEKLNYQRQWMLNDEINSQVNTPTQSQYKTVEELQTAVAAFLSYLDKKINYFDNLIQIEQNKIQQLRTEEHTARHAFTAELSRVVNTHQADQDFTGIDFAVKLPEQFKTAAGAEHYQDVVTVKKDTYLTTMNNIIDDVNVGKLPLHHLRTSIQEKMLAQIENQLQTEWRFIPPERRAMAINHALQSPELRNAFSQQLLGKMCNTSKFNDLLTNALSAERRLATAELRLRNYENCRNNLLNLKSNTELFAQHLKSFNMTDSSTDNIDKQLANLNNHFNTVTKQDADIESMLNDSSSSIMSINVEANDILKDANHLTSPSHLAFDSSALDPTKMTEKLQDLQTKSQALEEKCLGELSEKQQIKALTTNMPLDDDFPTQQIKK